MKDVDFLFEFARDHFAFKQSEEESSLSDTHQESFDDPETIRQVVSKQKIKVAIFRHYQNEIKSLLQQLEIHQNNLNHALEQEAKWGAALVPPIIENNIRDEMAEIKSKSSRLRHLLDLMANEPLPEEWTNYITQI